MKTLDSELPENIGIIIDLFVIKVIKIHEEFPLDEDVIAQKFSL